MDRRGRLERSRRASSFIARVWHLKEDRLESFFCSVRRVPAKTRTAGALAEVLHNSSKKLLRIDCGEFQMEQEVTKLVGRLRDLGHRETQPVLTQQKLNAAASEGSDLAIVLFDEIEKAAPSMTRLLLGVLDKGTLRLGDGTMVNFEKTVIFLTSNLGSREMNTKLHPDFGV